MNGNTPMQLVHNGSPGSTLTDALLAQRLAALIDGAPALSPATVGRKDGDNVTKVLTSPRHWTLLELAAVSEQLLTDPAIVYSQHPGVTRSRIRAILPEHRKAEAEQILHWLDTAQILAPPITPEAPFRHPRTIACATAAELADRLAAVPYPVLDTYRLRQHAECAAVEAM